MIRLRGYAIEELIGHVQFPAMIWLMLRGELPTEGQAELLGIALGAAVDHGPQAPSIAIARMAATCGVGINSAMASAINVLGDVHGGAGEQALEFFGDIAAAVDAASRSTKPFRPASKNSSPRRTATYRALGIASIRSIPARRACSSWSASLPRAA